MPSEKPSRSKPMSFIIAGIVLLCGSIFLFAFPTGKAWQVKYLGTYEETKATLTGTSLDYVGGARATDRHYTLSLKAEYTVNDKDYSSKISYKDFPDYDADTGEKWRTVLKTTYIDTQDTISIYYNPDRPSDAIIRPEDEQHPLLIILFILTVFVSIILITFGGVGLSSNTPTIISPNTKIN